MITHCILSEYIKGALSQAQYEKLEDGSYASVIPVCPGVIAFAPTLFECRQELQSVLEDWILLGFKLGHQFPIINHIDLNQEPVRESVDAM